MVKSFLLINVVLFLSFASSAELNEPLKKKITFHKIDFAHQKFWNEKVQTDSFNSMIDHKKDCLFQSPKQLR